MKLAQNTPLLAGESIMSWVARIARDQVGMPTFDFLNFIEFSRKDILEATSRGLERLANITGVPRAEFQRGAYLRIGERFYEHRGHRFHAEFAGRERTTFCPACLLEDGHADGPSRGRRVGRVNWLFSPVRTCPVHSLPLYRANHVSYADRFQDMALVAPDDRQLADLLAKAEVRAVSPMQSYVESRLDGKNGPEWLDGQQIDLAARATEMLGACLLYGPRVKLPELSEAQWDAAGATGFNFTARGEQGIREALEEMRRRMRPGATGGPQCILGRLFQWLQFNKSRKPRGQIREVVREFILDALPVEPGIRLFGEVVVARRRHSVASLARQKELDTRTLKRALVMTGLLPAASAHYSNGLLSVDAEEGERLADRMLTSIPVTEVPSYLNCHRRQAQMLVQHGLVKRIGDTGHGLDNILNMVPFADLDDFLVRLRASGASVEQPSAGMKNIIEASEIARWPVVDIVRLVLDRALSRIELLPAHQKFKSVLVDPDQVRFVCTERQARGRLSTAEAATRLKLQRWCVRALASNCDRDGAPFLRTFLVSNAKGAQRQYFDLDDLDRFAAAHVDLKAIAEAEGTSAKALRKRLSDRGVEPILPRSKLNKLVYRRADI